MSPQARLVLLADPSKVAPLHPSRPHTIGREANNLLWRDVEPITDSDGRLNVQLHVRGKTGQRIAVPHIDVKRILDSKRQREGAADADEFLFRMPSGSKIINLNDRFDAFLKHIGLTHSSAGEKFTLYSLRHFYAVRAIQRDIDIYTISRNMGTSVQIIQSYYGRTATPMSMATTLGGRVRVPTKQPRKPAKPKTKKPTMLSGSASPSDSEG